MDNENLSFLASYLAAYRIEGYLFANQVINPSTVEQEVAVICEFAGQIREIIKDTNIKSLYQYKAQYGLDSIIAALEFDIRTRGSEWEMTKIANNTLEKLKGFSG